MGIKSFSRFLDEYAATAIESIDMRQLYGTTVSVDESLFMHKFSHRRDNTVSDCVQRFLCMNNRFASHHISAIYVFDGEPPVEKTHVLLKRAKRKQRLRATGKGKSIVTQDHYRALMQALREKHIDFLCATNDAEKTCAWLCKSTITDAVFTDDYDSLAFGASIMVRDGNKSTMQLIDRSKILTATGFTDSDFTNFCLLCGSEYTPPHLRYGYKKAALRVKELRANTELQTLSEKFSLPLSAPPVTSASCKQLLAYVACRIVLFLVECETCEH